MGLLQPVTKSTSFAKMALFGFPKSGKTHTSAKVAIGLAKLIGSKKPVAFVDTEGGIDYVAPMFAKEGIEVLVARTRAFKDHIEVLKEAEQKCDILVFDSVTHSWEDVQESYKKKKNKTSLAFQDWGIIKPTFSELANRVLVCKTHVILCIRAAWEWDYFENDEGKMELYKVGTKMRLEATFAYEPSLLVEMERVKDDRKLIHRAWVLGDRSDALDGKSFDNPTFKDFKPHFDFILADGGEHAPLDLSRNSEEMFDKDGSPKWKREAERKTIALEEIQGSMVKIWPGQSVADKTAKGDFLDAAFGTRSWTAVEKRTLLELENAVKKLRLMEEMFNRELSIKDNWHEAERAFQAQGIPNPDDQIPEPGAGTTGQDQGLFSA